MKLCSTRAFFFCGKTACYGSKLRSQPPLRHEPCVASGQARSFSLRSGLTSMALPDRFIKCTLKPMSNAALADMSSAQPTAHFTTVPALRMGSGTRLKILEAMAAGCAIVATTLAAAGLPDEARSALVLADDATEMAQAIVTLLQDESQRNRLGESAKALVQQHYDWSVLIPRLLAVYKEIGLG